MTKQEILEKAIQKAIAGGWNTYSDKYEFRGNGVYWIGYITGLRQSYRDILFEQDFAKALWGDEPKICSQCDRTHDSSSDCDCGGWPISGIPYWQYHLQQMVIADDPIKYLGENT